MNNENLEVLEMDKNPNYMFNAQNDMTNDDMNDDFFDDDLVDLDFNGLDASVNNEPSTFTMPTVNLEPVNPINVAPINSVDVVNNSEPSKENAVSLNTDVKENESTEEVKTEKIDDKDNLDNSYVLSNFDVLFDSLYNDVVGANNLISDLIEKKSSLNRNEKILKVGNLLFNIY